MGRGGGLGGLNQIKQPCVAGLFFAHPLEGELMWYPNKDLWEVPKMMWDDNLPMCLWEKNLHTGCLDQ